MSQNTEQPTTDKLTVAQEEAVLKGKWLEFGSSLLMSLNYDRLSAFLSSATRGSVLTLFFGELDAVLADVFDVEYLDDIEEDILTDAKELLPAVVYDRLLKEIKEEGAIEEPVDWSEFTLTEDDLKLLVPRKIARLYRNMSEAEAADLSLARILELEEKLKEIMGADQAFHEKLVDDNDDDADADDDDDDDDEDGDDDDEDNEE